ncbi:MAG: leucyl aminopeptidase [Chloroflexota bacterium]
MEIKLTVAGSTNFKTSALMLGIMAETKTPEGELALVDQALGGTISTLIAQSEIKGKSGEVTLIHTQGKLPAERVVIVGLGKAGELTPDRLRGAVAGACRHLRRKWIGDAAITLLGNGINGISPRSAAEAITEGALLGTYTFRRHITREPEHGEIKELTILVPTQPEATEANAGCKKGKILAEAVIFTRDMANEPANVKTPTTLAEKATELAERYGLKVTVFDREKMRELGMGGLLGVAQGSAQPPKFIILEYHGRGDGDFNLALVGKGITFDSGGISIKPAENMGEMKTDMAGGASVMAAISAIAQLKPKINVISIIPATENLPSGTAFKPGDIIRAMNGKTMEIITTDAEGRLILSDALSYAVKTGVKAIVDVATLTGACIVALGDVATGAFTNNQELMQKVFKAGEASGELIWQLPMFDEYKEQIKSDVADIKNSGGRPAGAITAALFLAEFVGNTPWVHLDIAGTSVSEKDHGYLVKGATGVPVRTLVELALTLAK